MAAALEKIKTFLLVQVSTGMKNKEFAIFPDLII